MIVLKLLVMLMGTAEENIQTVLTSERGVGLAFRKSQNPSEFNFQNDRRIAIVTAYLYLCLYLYLRDCICVFA